MDTNIQLKNTYQANHKLALLSDKKINQILNEIADEISVRQDWLLVANQKDLKKINKNNPKYDRLKLSPKRLDEISVALRELANFKSPIGEIIEQRTLKNGLELQKIRVPLGVIGIIFEARPNVFFDCFALCFKSKNACVLKGSRDAFESNSAIFELIQNVLTKNSIDSNIICFLSPKKEVVETLFNAHGLVDILIPRGGQNLINFVRENAKIPTIETGAGIVHTYVDKFADDEKAANIIYNAKTSRVSVCNALDCLILHESKLNSLIQIVEKLAEKNVIIYADEKSFAILNNNYPNKLLKKADETSFGTEFLDYKISIKTVANIDEAIEHITKYSSKHSEAIISENQKNIDKFLQVVDAAAVYANASTRFTDGSVFGLGAEIGISTQKLHARGPMGIREITSYKWVVKGRGQIRS